MTKLPHNSLQNIYRTEIKALLKDNKAISGFSDFVRDYVGDVLKNEGKFEKEDFELLSEFIENKKDYTKIFKEKFQNYENISYEIIDNLHAGLNKDEFINKLEQKQIKSVLKISNEKNIYHIAKLLNNGNNKYDIDIIYSNKNLYNFVSKTSEEKLIKIIRLCENIDDLIEFTKNDNNYEFISKISNEKFTYCFKIYNIQNLYELIFLINKNPSFKVINYITNETFKLLSDITKSSYQFDIIINDAYVKYIITGKNKNIFYKLLQNQENLDYSLLRKISNNNKIFRIFNDTNIQTLEKILKVYNIKNIENLIKNIEDEKDYKILYKIAKTDLKTIMLLGKFYNLSDLNSFKRAVSNKNISYILSNYEFENLDFLMKTSKTKEVFENLISNRNLVSYLKNADISNLQKIKPLLNKINDFNKLIKLDIDLLLNKITDLKLINRIISITGNLDNFRDFINHARMLKLNLNNKNIDFLLNLSHNNLENFFNLCLNGVLKYILDYTGNKNLFNIVLTKGRFTNTETKNLYIDYLNKKILNSKKNSMAIFRIDINITPEFMHVFEYLLKHKQKYIIDFIYFQQNIRSFKLKNIEFDKEIFQDKEKLEVFFNKITKKDKNSQRKINKFNNYLKGHNEIGLEKFIYEEFLQYFEEKFKENLKRNILSDINLNYNLGIKKIDENKITNDFIESYKILINSDYNIKASTKLINAYISGKFDNLEELNQYKTLENNKWRNKFLSNEQKEIWLSKNRKEIDINDDIDYSIENKDNAINNHFEIAIKKIKEINKIGSKFNTDFKSAGELVNYYYTDIAKHILEIDSNLINDLRLQIDSINNLFNKFKAKKISKIIIEKEFDPIKCLLMGNLVDGSCLSFYSNVKNYFSVILNTVDINKGVFYLKDQNEEIIGRCLVTIGNDKKISRYKMYYSGNIQANINYYFDKYMAELANKIGLPLNGNEDKVKAISGEIWYKDGIEYVNN